MLAPVTLGLNTTHLVQRHDEYCATGMAERLPILNHLVVDVVTTTREHTAPDYCSALTPPDLLILMNVVCLFTHAYAPTTCLLPLSTSKSQ